jgi:hypothetical protein
MPQPTLQRQRHLRRENAARKEEMFSFVLSPDNLTDQRADTSTAKGQESKIRET